ncbi:hypothetical protein BKA65DRAFT_563323 [Rhexocercosporidium sp. MPI-PUGE-AT-0058]|nr:hypothetical protein BKA65DRAFT_563323 [Rhexocercosporidium sp. MPI-PUGE-AT-0058]
MELQAELIEVCQPSKILFKLELRGPLDTNKLIELGEAQTLSNKPQLPSSGTPPSSDERGSGATIIVRPRIPALATHAPGGEVGLAVENAVAALRNFESALLSSHRTRNEGIAGLANEKSAVKRIKLREQTVETQEIDLQTREKTLKDLEDRIHARGKEIGGHEAAASHRLVPPAPPPPPPFLLSMPLSLPIEIGTRFKETYVKNPLGYSHAGMYARTGPVKRVTIAGKRYDDDQFLQVFTGET